MAAFQVHEGLPSAQSVPFPFVAKKGILTPEHHLPSADRGVAFGRAVVKMLLRPNALKKQRDLGVFFFPFGDKIANKKSFLPCERK